MKRDDFERWFCGEDSKVKLERFGDSYLLSSAHQTWMGWQACTAIYEQREREGSDPVAYVRMENGKIDWDENCLGECPSVVLEGYEDDSAFSAAPLYTYRQPDRTAELEKRCKRLEEALRKAQPACVIASDFKYDEGDEDAAQEWNMFNVSISALLAEIGGGE